MVQASSLAGWPPGILLQRATLGIQASAKRCSGLHERFTSGVIVGTKATHKQAHNYSADQRTQFSSPLSPLHVYRHLCRALSRHPSFRTQERKSLHKLLRDDFMAACRSATSVEDLNKRASSTLLLLLAAGPRREPGADYSHKSRSLAMGMLINLSHLTYFNLSPNTFMPSTVNPRLAGGSDGSSSQGKPARKGAAVVIDLDDDDLAGQSRPAEGGRVIRTLAYPARPVRGPSRSESQNVRTPWDGQRPSNHLARAGVEDVAVLQRTVDRLEAEQRQNATPPTAAAREQLKNVRGLLKGARKVERRERSAQSLRDDARWKLMYLVQRAAAATTATQDAAPTQQRVDDDDHHRQRQTSSSSPGERGEEPHPYSAFLFGQSRWKKWFNREFLPP